MRSGGDLTRRELSGGGLTGREDWKLPMVIGGRESPRLTVARELPMVTGGRELPREREREKERWLYRGG